jgi:hypothetical protein
MPPDLVIKLIVFTISLLAVSASSGRPRTKLPPDPEPVFLAASAATWRPSRAEDESRQLEDQVRDAHEFATGRDTSLEGE